MRPHVRMLLAFTALATIPLAAQERTLVHVRLATPVASYSAVGTPFEAKVIGAVHPNKPSPLPIGSRIVGTVADARSIGLGLKRERASLGLDFEACALPNGAVAACDVVLTGVDNARETITRDGRIQGILAASHPHSWLSGVWFRPGSALSKRAASGLTGAGGRLQSALAPSAIGAVVTVASRLFLFRLPDPEIELPSGSDLIVEVLSDAEPTPPCSAAAPVSPETREWLTGAEVEVVLANGRPAADIINIALFGTKEDVAAAFQAAGWRTADPLTPRTFARSYAAAAQMRSYPTAPVSPLRYGGRLPDLVFQKTLNSLAKRHHIRLWQVETPDGTAWLGAATHDVGVAFDWNRVSLTHRIDVNIDPERQKVMYDLRESGCLAESGLLERSGKTRDTATRGAAITDGALLVARLAECSQRTNVPATRTKRPKRAFTTVLARRFILEGRHYVTRGNAYYWGYRGIRWLLAPSASGPPSHQESAKIDGFQPKSVKEVLNPQLTGTGPAAGARPRS